MFENKKFLMVLSLLISIVLWGFVIGDVNPTITTTLKDVPVQLLSVDTLASNGLAIVNDEGFTVDVEIEAKRADITNLDRTEIIVSANLASCTEGENYVPLKLTTPSNINIISIRNENILVTVDQLANEYMPIRVAYDGQEDKSEYEVVTLGLSLDQVEVSGAKSRVSKVAYVEALCDYNDLGTEEKTVPVKLYPLNNAKEIVQGISLSNNTAEVKAILYPVKTVELNVITSGEAMDGYEVEAVSQPTKLIIKGEQSLLDSIETVESIPIDLSELTEDTTVAIQYNLPEGVYVSNTCTDLKVEFRVKLIESDDTGEE